jgi:hypothetical protein
MLPAITLLALTGVASAVLADAGYSPGLRSGMRWMRAMMQGCGAMMQGDSPSGRPNEQWRENRRSTPDRRE